MRNDEKTLAGGEIEEKFKNIQQKFSYGIWSVVTVCVFVYGARAGLGPEAGAGAGAGVGVGGGAGDGAGGGLGKRTCRRN